MKKHPFHQYRHSLSITRRMSTIAAVVLLFAILGGLTTGVILVRQHGHSAATPPGTATAPSPSTPTPLPSAIYLSTDSTVYKLDLSTGKTLWSYQALGKANPGWIGGTPVLAGNLIYFSTSSDVGVGSIYALSARDGTLRWRYQIPEPEQDYLAVPPAVVDGTVYVGGVLTGYVYALNASDGTLRWRARVPVPTSTQPYEQLGPMVVADGIAYVTGTSDTPPPGHTPPPGTVPNTSAAYSTLFALNASNGAPLWSDPAPTEQLFGALEISNDMLLLTSENVKHNGLADTPQSAIYAYQPQTGALLWRFQVQESGVSGPTLANGVVYFSTASNLMYALDAAHGTRLWAVSIPGLAPYVGFMAPPQVGDGTLYTLGNTTAQRGIDTIVALDAQNGSVRWLDHDLADITHQIVKDGVLYVASAGNNGEVDALNVSDHSVIWKVQLSTNQSTPIGGLLVAP